MAALAEEEVTLARELFQLYLYRLLVEVMEVLEVIKFETFENNFNNYLEIFRIRRR